MPFLCHHFLSIDISWGLTFGDAIWSRHGLPCSLLTGLSQWKWRVELEEDERRGKPRLNSSVAKSLWFGCLFCHSIADVSYSAVALRLGQRRLLTSLRETRYMATGFPTMIFCAGMYVSRLCETTMKRLSNLECDLLTTDTVMHDLYREIWGPSRFRGQQTFVFTLSIEIWV